MIAAMLAILLVAEPSLPTQVDLDRIFANPRLEGCDELACSYDTRTWHTREVVCRWDGPGAATCDYLRMAGRAGLTIAHPNELWFWERVTGRFEHGERGWHAIH